MTDGTLALGILAVALLAILIPSAYVILRYKPRGLLGKPRDRGAADRSEALFRSMFPELQPHFHPRKLVDYVHARRASRPPRSGKSWTRPPGFEADRAEIRFDNGSEHVRLLDAAGALVGQFLYEEHAQGGVLRVGKGKLTVDIRDRANPAMRYWHPKREFKWRNGRWTFQTRVSDASIDSGDRGTSYSGDSSPSSASSIAAGAAAAAGIAAARGAFDGGGASAAWSEAGGASSTNY